jgi:tetratricopeptide (TPR) repeat protein
LKLLNLQPTIQPFRFELSKEYQRLTEIMNRSFAFVLITSLALCGSPVCLAQAKKNPEANKLAREGVEAAKNQDFDQAVDLLKKATAMDKKYGDELSAVYQQRAYAAANDQRYGDAINDYDEALKLTPQNAARIHEQRAAVEMKIQDYDKALADYSELIKQKPNEIKYLNYRAYIYELKDDLQNSLADNEKILKLDPNNQDAKTRKQRIEQKITERTPLTPPPRSPTASPTQSPKAKKKP